MDMTTFYLLLSALFAIGNIVLSIIYYIKIKEIWRYVKLWYIVANAFILIIIVETLLGHRPDGEIQLLGIVILLASQFSGLLVSISKVNVAEELSKKLKKVKDETQLF